MTHELKIRPEFFEAIVRGDKTFEVRYNDRNYQLHDILVLQEHDGENYTGRVIKAEVTYLLVLAGKNRAFFSFIFNIRLNGAFCPSRRGLPLRSFS